MKKLRLPDWTKSMPDNACLMHKEVAEIFGYAPISLYKGIDRGLVPKSDGKANGAYRCGREAKSLWSLGYLRGIESKQVEISELESQLLSMCKGLEDKE